MLSNNEGTNDAFLTWNLTFLDKASQPVQKSNFHQVQIYRKKSTYKNSIQFPFATVHDVDTILN